MKEKFKDDYCLIVDAAAEDSNITESVMYSVACRIRKTDGMYEKLAHLYIHNPGARGAVDETVKILTGFTMAEIATQIEEGAEEEPEEYCPSATAGDYGPGCPWNAPGMSIRDFI